MYKCSKFLAEAAEPHSIQTEIYGRKVPAAAACPTICIICCQLFHSDYCAAASPRNLLNFYMTPGTTSLQQTPLGNRLEKLWVYRRQVCAAKFQTIARGLQSLALVLTLVLPGCSPSTDWLGPLVLAVVVQEYTSLVLTCCVPQDGGDAAAVPVPDGTESSPENCGEPQMRG